MAEALSRAEAAVLLGCSADTIDRRIERGNLKVTKEGKGGLVLVDLPRDPPDTFGYLRVLIREYRAENTRLRTELAAEREENAILRDTLDVIGDLAARGRRP